MEDIKARFEEGARAVFISTEGAPEEALHRDRATTLRAVSRLSLFAASSKRGPRRIRKDVVLREDVVVLNLSTDEALSHGWKRRGAYFVAPALPARGSR